MVGHSAEAKTILETSWNKGILTNSDYHSAVAQACSGNDPGSMTVKQVKKFISNKKQSLRKSGQEHLCNPTLEPVLTTKRHSKFDASAHRILDIFWENSMIFESQHQTVVALLTEMTIKQLKKYISNRKQKERKNGVKSEPYRRAKVEPSRSSLLMSPFPAVSGGGMPIPPPPPYDIPTPPPPMEMDPIHPPPATVHTGDRRFGGGASSITVPPPAPFEPIPTRTRRRRAQPVSARSEEDAQELAARLSVPIITIDENKLATGIAALAGEGLTEEDVRREIERIRNEMLMTNWQPITVAELTGSSVLPAPPRPNGTIAYPSNPPPPRNSVVKLEAPTPTVFTPAGGGSSSSSHDMKFSQKELRHGGKLTDGEKCSLEMAYQGGHLDDKGRRQEIADLLELPIKKVTIWRSNRKAKEKKGGRVEVIRPNIQRGKLPREAKTMLENAFQKGKWDKSTKDLISAVTTVPSKQISVWFSNRRAKARKDGEHIPSAQDTGYNNNNKDEYIPVPPPPMPLPPIMGIGSSVISSLSVPLIPPPAKRAKETGVY